MDRRDLKKLTKAADTKDRSSKLPMIGKKHTQKNPKTLDLINRKLAYLRR